MVGLQQRKSIDFLEVRADIFNDFGDAKEALVSATMLTERGISHEKGKRPSPSGHALLLEELPGVVPIASGEGMLVKL